MLACKLWKSVVTQTQFVCLSVFPSSAIISRNEGNSFKDTEYICHGVAMHVKFHQDVISYM